MLHKLYSSENLNGLRVYNWNIGKLQGSLKCSQVWPTSRISISTYKHQNTDSGKWVSLITFLSTPLIYQNFVLGFYSVRESVNSMQFIDAYEDNKSNDCSGTADKI